MNAVQTWTLAVCFSVLAVSLLQYLLPKGSMEKMMRFLVGTFLVCAFLYPVKEWIPQIPQWVQFPTYQNNYEDFSSLVEEQQIQAAEMSIKNLVSAEMNDLGIPYKNIGVDMDIEENGSIGINRISIELEDGYQGYGLRVCSLLSEKLGVEVEVEGNE